MAFVQVSSYLILQMCHESDTYYAHFTVMALRLREGLLCLVPPSWETEEQGLEQPGSVEEPVILTSMVDSSMLVFYCLLLSI